MRKTSSQKKKILNAIGKLKGNIYKGLTLDRYIRKMFAPFESHKKDWRLDKNIDDCSYIDDAENPVNEFYVHVEVTEDIYMDIFCIINNIEDEKNDWIVLVKDIIIK